MFFEHFSVGQRFTTGSRTLTQDDIVAFASQWDRQYFHLDAEAAKGSAFGGLVASGFHTLVVTFDLVIEAAIWTEASLGSPGIDAVRWLKPVRPGDTLTGRWEVLETRASRERPRGYIRSKTELMNQDGETIHPRGQVRRDIKIVIILVIRLRLRRSVADAGAVDPCAVARVRTDEQSHRIT